MPEERTLVTVLFADVTDSTTLGEELDPEDLRLLMARYYEHARRVVSEHGGTLEKFIGDAVMAVFGLPHVYGDEAERALSAALALRQAVAEDEILGRIFQLHLGVNTGEVIATSNPASGDFLVTGDVVNVAARLQQAANPDEILVGERTVKAVRQGFLFAPARDLLAKGKRQPLQVFPLKCASSLHIVERPPLVGRKQDLLQLNLLLERALEEERPQLVSLIAPAGTGKSRLLDEFLRQLDPSTGFLIATARCLPYGQTLTYWPLRGLLDALLNEETTRTSVLLAFLRAQYLPEDAARLTTLILRTLGLEGEGTIDRESIFMAWRLLIEALTRKSPRIIIFEDLHWASDGLLDLLEHITQLHTSIPLLLISLSRPELLDRRPNWGGGRQNFTALSLQPLTGKQTQDLLIQIAPGLSQEVRTRLVERSGGNPFFALELLHGLRDDHATGDQLVLPDTVHAAVLARLSLLSRLERQILQVASVVNRSFTLPLLVAILPTSSSSELERALTDLQMREMLTAVEQGKYIFRHALIRDVAYNTLTRAERLRLHELIALALEQQPGEMVKGRSALIAYHYNEVVRLFRQSTVQTPITFDVQHALHHLRQAGIAASFSGAYIEAQEYLEHALQIAPEEELCALYELLGDSLPWSIDSMKAYEQALAEWRKCLSEDALNGARLLRKLLMHYTRGGGHEYLGNASLAAWRAEAQSLAEIAHAEDELHYLHVVDDFLFWVSPEYSFSNLTQAQQINQETIAYFAHQGNTVALSEALDGYCTFAMLTGSFSEGVEAAQRRLTIPDLPALERGDAASMVALCLASLSRYEESIQVIERALTELRPGQPAIHLAQGITRAVASAYICGQWSRVEPLTSWLYAALNQSSFNNSLCHSTIEGFFYIFRIALAHEHLSEAQELAATLQHLSNDLFPDYKVILALTQYLLRDEIGCLNFADLTSCKSFDAFLLLNVCSEYNLPVPTHFIALARKRRHVINVNLLVIDLAEALAAQEYARMAFLIDELIACDCIVHATRMRLVLAQRTGDHEQLALARPVLERLGDQQFLRKLAEIEASPVC
jgi:class 3 adenylate cyclase/tetratricopeptide (TPR) repeat protein